MPDIVSSAKILYGNQDDSFGECIATNGTYIAIGSPYFNGDLGKVDIYKKDSNNDWINVQTLSSTVPSSTSPFFGFTVSMYEDHLIVTAFGANDQAGCIYYYVFDSNTNQFVQSGSSIIAQNINGSSDEQTNGNFGLAADIKIINSTLTLIASAPIYTNPNNSQGKVYVYKYINSTWTITSILSDPENAANKMFGSTVSLGSNGYIVGSPYYVVDGVNAMGKVTLFDTDYSVIEDFTDSSNIIVDRKLGISVSMNDNFAVFGAFDSNIPYQNGGYFGYYTWNTNTSSWSTSPIKLYSPYNDSANSFGSKVVLYDNYLAVGHPNFDNEKGLVVIYEYLYDIEGYNIIYLLQDVTPESYKLGDSIAFNGFPVAGAYFIDTVYIFDTINVEGSSNGGGNAEGDPHVKPILGSPYDLPHEEDTFLLYSNNSNEYPVSIKGKCWYLPECMYMKKINHLNTIGYYKRAEEYLKLFKKNMTYFRYIEFVCGPEHLIIDMETLRPCTFTSIEDVDSYNLPLSDKNYQSNNYINLSDFKHSKKGVRGKKPNKTTLDRVVTMRAKSSIVILTMTRDSRDFITRNSITINIQGLKKSDIGSLVRNCVIYSEFGMNYDNYGSHIQLPLKKNSKIHTANSYGTSKNKICF